MLSVDEFHLERFDGAVRFRIEPDHDGFLFDVAFHFENAGGPALDVGDIPTQHQSFSALVFDFLMEFGDGVVIRDESLIDDTDLVSCVACGKFLSEGVECVLVRGC